MSVPYTPSFTRNMLRGMSDAQLARITPASFQMWPVQHVLPQAMGKELIAHERATRLRVAEDLQHADRGRGSADDEGHRHMDQDAPRDDLPRDLSGDIPARPTDRPEQPPLDTGRAAQMDFFGAEPARVAGASG